MPNRLLERLGADYQQLTDQYETIINRCAEEGRDPTETEASLLDGLRSDMAPLGERIVELRATDERRFKAITAMNQPPVVPDVMPGSGRTPVVEVRSEPATYRQDLQERSFFKDLFDSTTGGDIEARSRLERNDLEVRALGTSATGVGNLPPPWLISEYAPTAHGMRPITDTLRRLPLTDARPITIGIQSPPGAVIGNQAAEGNEPVEGDFTSVPLVTVPQTKTGKVEVSRQLLDGSSPIVDALIFSDLMGALNENIEQTVVAAFTALAAGAIAGNFPIVLDTDVIPDAIIDAGTQIRLQRHAPPSVLFPSEIFWSNIVKQKDAAGRPLVTTGYHGPQNVLGLGESIIYGHVSGEIVGVPVVPSWALPDGVAYLCKADDLLVLESTTMQFRYEEVMGPQAIRLGVWEYFAVVLGRYPRGIARLTATGALPLSGGTQAAKK
jgi:hypothetical protein